MYVPAYPLPILELASFVKSKLPKAQLEVVSVPVDYGLPINKSGKEKLFKTFFQDLSEIKPKGVGISCTAISQAEETIELCEKIKAFDQNIFVFLGGYFPTIYYEALFSLTDALDAIVLGPGEWAALEIVEQLEKGEVPAKESIPNLVWKSDGTIKRSSPVIGFDLKEKAPLRMDLLRHPRAYDILPYAFSRGCPYRCNFCLEENIRPVRKEVPLDIVRKDMITLSQKSDVPTLLVADALFKSFDIFPLLRSFGMKANFETRCDVLDPSTLSLIANDCDMLALGFESASYDTLRRMNKVRDRSHYETYLSNTLAIFTEAAKNEIPLIVFMIAGYPGDTEKDLEESLCFAEKLSEMSGPGGHVFKIGECHVYPKTKIYDLAVSLPDVIFDDDGVFGQNVVRQPSKDLKFDTVVAYTKKIFNLSNSTPKFQKNFRNMMPFFRLPIQALSDNLIPDGCFRDKDRDIFNVQGESLSIFRSLTPKLIEAYHTLMSGERKTRHLPL
jgi:B12 binding domain/Radical SAM superfamily